MRSGHVDLPKVGDLDGELHVSGWVLAESGPVERVVALADGRLVARVRADHPRPDIAEAVPDLDHAEQSGFRILLPAAALRAAKEVVIGVEPASGPVIPIWRLALGYGPATSASRPQPKRSRRRLGRGRRKEQGAEPPPRETAPPDEPFRIVALLSTYNEEDIIEPVLDHLASERISSYLIDNDSTDATVARAERWLGRGLMGIERMPPAAGGRTAWQAILDRKVALSRELGADWYLHHDADEIRESPWPGMSLRDAIELVDRLGYNAIDFRVLNFPPVDDAFRDGDDPREHFTRWEDPAEYDVLQRKGWKAGFPDVSLEDGGHDVRFPDRRLFPLRFLLRHYPIRSQAHGTRKVLRERKERFVADEVAIGWHRQYEHVKGVDHSFMKNPAALRPFDLERVRLETALEDGRQAAAESEPEQRVPVKGFLDQAGPSAISGWAARTDGSGEPLEVAIWDGARLIATVTADQERPDLEKAGVGGGRGGFAIRTPRELVDGRPHWIWATVGGTALERSPLVLSSSSRPAVTPSAPRAEPAAVG